jgi:drug/metabolite transporter (DMT)-like permease
MTGVEDSTTTGDRQRAGLLALAGVIAIWSPSFAAIRLALRGYDPGAQALGRFIIASALVGALWWWNGRHRPRRADLIRTITAGAFGVAGYQLLLGYGEQTVTSASAALLTAISPLLVVLLSMLFLGERATFASVVGLALGISGTMLVGLAQGGQNSPGTLDLSSGALGFSSGALVVLGAAICQAVWVVLQKPLLARYHSLDVTAWTIWAGTLLMLPFIASLAQDLPHATPQATMAMLWLGIMPSALGFLIFAAATSRLPAMVVGSSLYLLPPSAVLVAWILLDELPSIVEAFGGALTIAGVVLVTRSSIRT